jgi:hypothetical protein
MKKPTNKPQGLAAMYHEGDLIDRMYGAVAALKIIGKSLLLGDEYAHKLGGITSHDLKNAAAFIGRGLEDALNEYTRIE